MGQSSSSGTSGISTSQKRDLDAVIHLARDAWHFLVPAGLVIGMTIVIVHGFWRKYRSENRQRSRVGERWKDIDGCFDKDGTSNANVRDISPE